MSVNCLECNNNRICSIYRDYKDIIILESCRLYSNKNSIQQPCLHVKNNQNNATIRTPINSEFSRIEQRSKLIEDLNKNKATNIVSENLASIVKCEDCGEEFNIFETTKCSKCGKTICLNCANEDVSTHKALCNNCYNEGI